VLDRSIAFVNEKGEYPDGCVAWQFNFKFNLNEDMYAQDSIDLLQEVAHNSPSRRRQCDCWPAALQAGIDFSLHERDGIDVHHFGELMITSGLVLEENVRWVSFHSGYDFGYLLKLLTCAVSSPRPLPWTVPRSALRTDAAGASIWRTRVLRSPKAVFPLHFRHQIHGSFHRAPWRLAKDCR
jgi:hypothetical protein